ncbi:MAG: hypothetical protein HYZ29_33820 [Myxococcales bacterium]|nr:hypothetical protein [Myxococcales bacterium]
MFQNALFVGWGEPVRGREQVATKVFGEWVEMLGSWKTKGSIESFTPVFLTPRGGELAGFFLITGNAAKLNELATGEEIRRATMRAELIVERFGVITAITGDEVGKQMALFSSMSAELAK